MIDYNLTQNTVTISIDEFRDFVYDSQRLNYLERAGVSGWEGYEHAMEEFDNDRDYSLYELTVLAFNIANDEDANDYELGVAYQWLQHMKQRYKMSVGDWCAIMPDLEEQLKAIAAKEGH